MTVVIVDSAEAVTSLIDGLGNLPTTPPSLYLDLEGVRLSRYGSISLIQLFVPQKKTVYLIDIHCLGSSAFSTAGVNNASLKSILESSTIQKVFFDVRNDSDALFSHYGIKLQGVCDLQLIENASRYGHISHKKFVSGLSRCIEQDAPITPKQKQIWKAVKARGVQLFDPQSGGSYEVFNERPLRPEIIAYCEQDVQYLPLLYNVYVARLDVGKWKDKVEVETKRRVLLSQSADYDPNASSKKFGPWISYI